jgi:hypothetical protein
MDLKQYFKKIKDTEETIKSPYPLIVSLETTDGGKAGVVVEVTRQEAAKALVDNRAVLATEEQKTEYFEREKARKKSAEKAELSRRLQIAIVSDSVVHEIKATPEKETESEKEADPKGSSR